MHWCNIDRFTPFKPGVQLRYQTLLDHLHKLLSEVIDVGDLNILLKMLYDSSFFDR